MAKDSRGGKGGSAGGIKKNPDEYRKFLKNKIATAKESLNEERNRANPDSNYMQKLKDKISGYEDELEADNKARLARFMALDSKQNAQGDEVVNVKPKVPQSVITVNENEFIGAHGQKPRGGYSYSSWYFEIGGKEYEFRGKYSVAKKQAIKKASELGERRIKTLS